MSILGRFAQRLYLPNSLPKQLGSAPTLRLQTHEVKSLACSILRKLSSPVDQTLWKRSKLPLCSLLLQHASELQAAAAQPGADSSAGTCDAGTHLPPAPSDPPHSSFRAAIGKLLQEYFEPEEERVQKLLASPLIPEAQKAAIEAKLAVKKQDLAGKVLQWCRDTAALPDFQLLQPTLSKVIDAQADPVFEQPMRDGQHAEDLVYQLLRAELQPGWSLCSSTQIQRVGDQPFVSKRFVKGEIDVLLMDPSGEVQAVVEVKTASGNPIMALYEDVIRFKALIEEVSGKNVCVQLPDRSRRTLRFSQNPTRVYVLACELQADGFASAAESARFKLLVAELGRLLSSQIQTWCSVTIVALTSATVTLQLTDECLAQLESTVASFFDSLGAFEIYSLKPEAKRQHLEAAPVVS